MERITERDFDIAVSKLIDSIVRASYKIHDNPGKMEAYIREKINHIYTAGKHVGSECLIERLFNPD